MNIKSIDQILEQIHAMTYDTRDNLAYFCAGMLYGMSVLEVDENAVVTLTETEEETE